MTKEKHVGMSRKDRKLWADARTLADCGHLMASYLGGGLSGWPGHPGRLDRETRGLELALAALCRAGYVTTCSQPGTTGRWQQRAAVDGFADPATAARITRAATAAGLDVLHQDTVVTTVDGKPYTRMGGRLPSGAFESIWPGLHRAAASELRSAQYLAVAAPEWGPSGDRMWPILAKAVR